MAIDVAVLGCSGTYAAPGGACSGYLVEAGGYRLLVDCGPGTLANLQRELPLDQLDAIVITHSHPDHWLELPVMRNAFRYVLERSGVALYSTAETLSTAEAVCGNGLAPTFVPTVITDGDDVVIGPVRARFARTQHSVETLSVRIDHDGASFAFSADTGPDWSFTALGIEIGIGMCEATSLDPTHAPAVHLTATQAGERGRAGRVQQLVLTHQLPGSDADEFRRQGSDAYGSPVHIASVGAHFHHET